MDVYVRYYHCTVKIGSLHIIQPIDKHAHQALSILVPTCSSTEPRRVRYQSMHYAATCDGVSPETVTIDTTSWQMHVRKVDQTIIGTPQPKIAACSVTPTKGATKDVPASKCLFGDTTRNNLDAPFHIVTQLMIK